MRQSQRNLEVTDIYTYRRYAQQILVMLGVLLFSLGSGSVFAFERNPGSNAVCPAGSTKGFLSSSSYSNILDSFTSKNYRDVLSQTTFSGSTTANIPLKIKMSIDDIGINNTGNNNTISGTPANPAIDINRNFNSRTSRSDITLDFQNADNGKETYLAKVALSVFDIDKNVSGGSGWDDLIKITGVTENDGVIEGTFQTIPNSSVTKLTNGLQTSSTSNNFNCTDSLQSACQGSVLFDKPVKSVTLRYSNTNNVTNPTTQRIQFRLDSYCYTPQYTFLGTVFDDNGGIVSTQADATNANFSSGPYANTNYFNGVFNAPTELGIAGSTVSLVNCTTPANVYATQQVAGDGTTLGQYQFNLPLSTFSGSTDICVIEDRTTGITTYPIRTSTDSIKVSGFSPTTYNYPNNNFGRVIAENAALVLRKAQYVNNCRADINYTDSKLNIAGNTNPNTGFSEYSITDNLNPGQCIAYRITATNRANSPINNFVMQDKLQKKEPGGALVTSVLANPISNTVDYASDSVPIGQNGVVKTNSFVLPLRSKRVFYFNTKYGTTVDP